MSDAPDLWLQHFPASMWGKVVDAHDPGQLVRPLRDAYWTIRTRARERGIRCEVASAYRTPYQQWRLRVGRVPDGEEMNPAFPGRPPTAVPGRSRHQRREAIDLDMSGAGFDWLEDSGILDDVGCDQTVRGERWHLQVVGAPRVELLRYPFPSFDDDDQEVDDMALSSDDINRIALVTAATVDKVLAKRFEQLGLPVIAGVDRILDDEQAELVGMMRSVLDRLDDSHGPA